MSSSARPVIGMNVDFYPATKTQKPHVRLSAGYFDKVLQAGGMPLIMPLFAREAELTDFLDRVDGFLLTGGLDLDPTRNGMPRHQAVRPMAERRENSDRMLVRLLLERQIPILATGVGMHQLNIACGGNLFLHLPEDMPRAMPHSDTSCPGPHRHAVILESGTRLEEIYGEGEIRVNSDHHQALRQIGTGFRVAAAAPDGVVEAIEASDPNWFCIGVQWQPECDTASALDAQLFECFVQACARAAEGLALAA
ncbi:MAG: gamma-glutamyl-gamma-aminobutyrate hydrolase family protein [Gemmataceae bacterium]